MKLKRFKEKNYKRTGVILFTVVCILLVSSVILYRTFAIFEIKTNQNVIKGTVEDPGNIYFAFYQKNEENESYEIQKDMPQQGSGYVLDEEKSYCGVNGNMDEKITVSLTENYQIRIDGVTTSRTKCNLYFAKGIFLMEHGVPVVTNGNGLYKVEHGEEVLETLDDTGFRQDEYRYVGVNPNNYVDFNNEKWRIIGLVNVMTSENDVEQRIKIVKEEAEGNAKWDENDFNDWTKSSLQNELNTTYLKKLENVKNLIEENIVWNIGGISSYQDNRTLKNYNEERGKVTYNDNPQTWKGAIALIYPSDYGFATSGTNIEDRKKCIEIPVYEWNNNETIYCVNNDWLLDRSGGQWTLSHESTKGCYLMRLDSEGYIGQNCKTLSNYKQTLYLKKEVKIVSGTGTKENSFQLDI